jgi:hypothetical protein
VATLKIIYDVDGRASLDKAVALRTYAPADFEVSLAPLHHADGADAALGAKPVDLVLVLGESNTAAVRAALRRRDWRSVLVAGWSSGFPDRIGVFYRTRAVADAWIFDDHGCWEASGCLPRTHAMPAGVDLEAGRSADFFALLRLLLGADNGARAPRADLSDAVTVFVTTVGAPSFANCLEHLREQDCTYTLRVIDRVAPMNAAFQRMLDDCRTPYFVQVDEDMLLYPHAVRTLHAAMTGAGPDVAIVAADLYDVHVERCIIGVKIFRHEIVRRYPFEASDAFEMRQVARLEADGYRVLRGTPGPVPVAGRTLGVHGTEWTPHSIYERYLTLERRRRALPPQLSWFREYPAVFLRRFLDEPSELNFFALLGVIAGALAPAEAGAKDYRIYSELQGFRALRLFLADFQRRTTDAVEESVARPRSRAAGSRHG